MLWRKRDSNRHEPSITDLMLRRWHFVAAATGELKVQAVESSLGYDELHTVLVGIGPLEAGTEIKRVVFDFRYVRAFESPWTAIFALLMHFARTSAARCVVSNLRGQPALAVGLYRRNQELAELLEMDRPTFDHDPGQ